jgi:hypothetical protein
MKDGWAAIDVEAARDHHDVGAVEPVEVAIGIEATMLPVSPGSTGWLSSSHICSYAKGNGMPQARKSSVAPSSQ